VEGSRPSPALILFFLSPAIGELLSGSAPPLEFFQPIAFLLLSALYGSGAVLVRELAHRWGKGWPTVLALGAAYGILEEGLMVKSFFDPHWVDLGILGEYGRWAGVNWVWSLNLTLYHAVFSISIPILLVGLIFPGRHGQAWVSQRTFRRLWVLLALVVAFGYFVLTPYRPPLLPYAMAALSACALFLAGRRLPERFLATDPSDVSPTSPFWFGAIAFLITAGAFVLGGLLPSIGLPPWVTMATQIALTLSASLVITKILSKGGSLTPTQQLALASGALGFFVLLSPLQELDPTRTDNPVGMSLVGLGASIFLAWLILRLRRRMSEEPRIAFHGR
jgi:hypothetical protein